MGNRILIITSNSHDAATLEEALQRAQDGPFSIEWVTRLSIAMERLRADNAVTIDAILVDLHLPDSQGLATFTALFALVPGIPIMTLSELDADQQTSEAIRQGAQGCLYKDYFNNALVPQALRNIILRKAVEEALFVEKTRLAITLNSISDAVIGTDLHGQVDYLNAAAERMTGWQLADAQKQPIERIMCLVHSKTREPVANPVVKVLQDNTCKLLAAGTLLIRRDGSESTIEDSAAPIHDSAGRLKGAVMVFHDITAAHAMTEKMTHLAQHDSLTNLPNRALLNDRIGQAIALAERHNGQLALLFLDLDNFKHINDSLGHSVGDQLLQAVALRLSDCVRGSDTVSRLGGDEFVVLLGESHSAEDAARTAEKILEALASTYVIADQQLHISASIGISTYPNDAENAPDLIRTADTAMYQAKEEGRNNYQFFRSEMNVRAVERQVVEAHLRSALEKDQFILHYQPKIDLHSGRITSAEALIRWQHPSWGIILPARFIPVAEACGLIVPLGRWVLQQACKQAKRWENCGYVLDSVAVNISALEFRRQDFVDSVREALQSSDLDAHKLQLEITESVLMRDAQASATILQQLKNLGVQLAVDDFGTGYSSLSYLTQFPIDVLKIDRTFVQAIENSNGIIVSAVIAMGNSLKQRVIAEGIEEPAQLEFLRHHQCGEGQGYLFSHPVSVEQFTHLLRSGIHSPINTLANTS
ncbi:EAL domain-containing protein [Pseudomonas sp. SL4(2022)]|uniref:putative bifunctional diguanylate cyclase/phosphodiesterase n=1 Tax=Pseudomonas sp. SL4(2022) TaxID=2994661 RepID=UPI0022705CA6|nr:EAL domain-containing protein [Pseudomonas sp. SL4(2022)]WAC43432.1 EAL domain-containing protein [Pseudomonas sp. SL4(2022)]